MYVYQAGSLGSAMNWLAITSNCKQFKLQIAKFLQLIAMNWTTSLMYIYFIFTYAYNNTIIQLQLLKFTVGRQW